MKKVRAALAEQDVETAKSLLAETASLIDRMVKEGVIHANSGSRYLSRLARKVSSSTAG